MAAGTPRRSRRAGAGQRRTPSVGSTLGSMPQCAVGGCDGAGQVGCRRCGRTVCLRHGGLSHGLTADRGATARCALCRLEDRRRGQSTVKRFWWAISVAGFTIFVVLAIRGNPRQGIALLLLAVLILVLALCYDRLLRRF